MRTGVDSTAERAGRYAVQTSKDPLLGSATISRLEARLFSLLPELIQLSTARGQILDLARKGNTTEALELLQNNRDKRWAFSVFSTIL